VCHYYGQGAPQDLDEALRCFKRAAAKGLDGAAAAVDKLQAQIAAR
jgi:TPR repeat protein